MPAWKYVCSILLTVCSAVVAVPAQAITSWLPFGPDGGDARRIAVDPKDQSHLFLGTTNGWIYESHDSGSAWRRLARVGKRDDLVLDSIVVDVTNPNHIIVGAWVIDHPDGGMYISQDGGKTWLNQAEMRGQSIRALAASASDPKILVAGTLKGVYRSVDGGLRWKQISPLDSTEIHEIESVAIDPKDPGVIYAGTWHLPWKTSDAGEHWDNIKDGIIDDSDVFSIIIDPMHPEVVYASACSGIYKSENAGVQFRKVQGIPSTARRTRVLLQDPAHSDIVFAGTTEGLFRSVDAGKTWTRTTGPEIIVNDVFVNATDSHRVLIATDRGGVMASDDGGDTFHSSNGGFSSRQITTLKRDLNHPARLYVGIVNDKEWGGVFESNNGAVSWTQRSEGLQGRDVFSLGQAPDGTMIAGTSHGLFRLDTTAQLWQKVTDAPGVVAAAAPARQVVTLTRPPVPIERNHFADRRVNKAMTPMQRKAALRNAKGKTLNGRGSKLGANRPVGKKAKLLAAKKLSGKRLVAKKQTVSKGRNVIAVTSRKKTVPAQTAPGAAKTVVGVDAPAPEPTVFDGSVSAIVTAGRTLLATTSLGLLSSSDDGITWATAGPKDTADWHFMAAAKQNVVSATLHTMYFSPDAGVSWSSIQLPAELTQVSAIAVEPSGQVWVGGREGVFVSADAGRTWTTPKNLFVNSVNGLYFDEATNRILVTTGGYSSIVFSVQLPQKSVTFVDTGWNLRFARPVGDHMVAATLFDGIVIQPRMVALPMANTPAAAATVPQ